MNQEIFNFIKENQNKWFFRLKQFLGNKNLNVGSGFGFFCEAANNNGFATTSLDIAIHEGTINKEKVVLYDGKTIPFPDKSFDTSVTMYVLHHTPNPEVVINEMKRVSKRLIVVEEVYKNIFQKIKLFYVDYKINFGAKQKSILHWNSYYTKENLYKDLEKDDWKVTHFESEYKSGFYEVVCVVDKI